MVEGSVVEILGDEFSVMRYEQVALKRSLVLFVFVGLISAVDVESAPANSIAAYESWSAVDGASDRYVVVEADRTYRHYSATSPMWHAQELSSSGRVLWSGDTKTIQPKKGDLLLGSGRLPGYPSTILFSDDPSGFVAIGAVDLGAGAGLIHWVGTQGSRVIATFAQVFGDGPDAAALASRARHSSWAGRTWVSNDQILIVISPTDWISAPLSKAGKVRKMSLSDVARYEADADDARAEHALIFGIERRSPCVNEDLRGLLLEKKRSTRLLALATARLGGDADHGSRARYRRLLDSGQDRSARQVALRYAFDVLGNNAIPVLANVLKSNVSGLGGAAFKGLRRSGPAASSFISRELNVDHTDIRLLEALVSLAGETGEFSMGGAIRQHLRHAHSRVRLAAYGACRALDVTFLDSEMVVFLGLDEDDDLKKTGKLELALIHFGRNRYRPSIRALVVLLSTLETIEAGGVAPLRFMVNEVLVFQTGNEGMYTAKQWKDLTK